MDGSPTSCISSAFWESSLCRRQRLNGACHFRGDLVGTWNGIHIPTFACPAALARGGGACVAFPPVLWQLFRVTETQAWFLEGDGHALECKVPLVSFSSQVFELHEHLNFTTIVLHEVLLSLSLRWSFHHFQHSIHSCPGQGKGMSIFVLSM